MQVELEINIDLNDIIERLNATDRWDLLQVLWNSLKNDVNKLDWESFYEENDVYLVVKQIPCTCPTCGSDEIEGKAVNITVHEGIQQATQPCSCLVCNEEWTDTYTLSSVDVHS